MLEQGGPFCQRREGAFSGSAQRAEERAHLPLGPPVVAESRGFVGVHGWGESHGVRKLGVRQGAGLPFFISEGRQVKDALAEQRVHRDGILHGRLGQTEESGRRRNI